MAETPTQKALATQAHHRELRDRRKIIAGLLLMGAGYFLLAVAPDMAAETVLVRVTFGFALLFVGFALVVLPFIENLFKQ